MRALTLTSFFRKKLIAKPVALTLLIALVAELVLPATAYAIGGGPSQPEATAFTPASASDMVDPFSGDFNYNIPLLDVDGYPVNVAYSSGINMEQEASWVGLGWNLNVGALNRTKRGIPDDFKGDEIKKEANIKNNHTYGVNAKLNVEFTGIDLGVLAGAAASTGLGVNWNTYNGTGFEFSLDQSISASNKSGFGLTTGLGINASSSTGTDLDFSVSPSYTRTSNKTMDEGTSQTNTYSPTLGFGYNSATGFNSMTVGLNIQRDTYKQNQETGEKEHVSNEKLYEPKNTHISFGFPFRIPQSRMPMFNTNVSLSATLGMEAYGVHGNIKIRGYYAGQFLKDKEKNVPSFGYLNTHEGQRNEKAMLDFNREKEGTYTENTPRLPVTNYTYDVLSIHGQGISGMYRPYRNDVGVMRDDEVRNISAGLDFPGMEFGAASAFHMGVDFHVNVTDAYSGRWKSKNDAFGPLEATEKQKDLYEPYYFKKLGEKNADENTTFNNTLGNDLPIRVNLIDHKQEAAYEVDVHNGSRQTLPSNMRKNTLARAKRNEPLFGLTTEESYMMLDKKIRVYNFIASNQAINGSLFTPGPSNTPYTDISRTGRPLHHMSEYTAVNSGGMRYVYGIPAYNNFEQEVTFNLPEQASSCYYPDVAEYTSTDDSKNNENGIDNFYERVTTPQYAHSYLLTAVLSDDYTDRTGNGPSDDDKGTYTRFNYSRISSYKWRSPYTDKVDEKGQAFYNPGLGIDKLDDKASYSYGEKELWYLHSIETKNYIAVFVTEDRLDGCAIAGPMGDRGTVKSKLLKRIELYVKSELLNSTTSNKAIPVKVVHFKYDYSLCKNLPSNDRSNLTLGTGKLTLTGIYFTYGNSTRAASRGYTFNYTTGAGAYENPDYSNKAYDRWGSFKPLGLVSNAEWPYAEQDKANADAYAGAWNLKMITLPSGGQIKIEYESDDYGFVQDRRAMRMFSLVGSTLTKPPHTISNTFTEEYVAPALCEDETRRIGMLYEPASGGINCTPAQYFYLKVNEPVASVEELREKYFTDENGETMRELYFRFYVKTEDGSDNKSNNYESVPGYISMSDLEYGICENYIDGEGKTEYIWIRLKPVNIGDYVKTGNANPISRAAWNMLKVRYPRLGQLRSDFDPDKFNFMAIYGEMASSAYQVYQTMFGYNFSLRQRNLCRTFDCDRSMFRLYSPDQKKIGGGSRVKRVLLNDQFSALSGSSTLYSNAEYGKEYFYTTQQNGREISSGVAAYEPMLGGEESPFRNPVARGIKQKFMAIGTEYLQEGKFGESFYPAATVGYRKVTIKSIKKSNSRSTATGREEREFYTNYEFPFRVDETGLEFYRRNPKLLFSIFKFGSVDHLATSMGYAVEMNDMAGKPRAVKGYSESGGDVPVNSTEYFYKRSSSDPRMLDNTITTIDNKGIIHPNTRVGVETDIVADMREESNITHGGSLANNLESFIAFVPVALPFFVPKYTRESVKYRSSVVTKVVNKSGLLDSVVVKDLGARKTTQNLALDAETGEVLVTRINNDFNDDVYQVNLPAYWIYEEMAPAYKRTGLKHKLTDVLNNPTKYLVPGDEVAFGQYYGWVTNVSPNLGILSSSGIYYNIAEIMEEEAVSELKIVRSANHNKTALPASSTVVKNNPLAGSQLTFTNVVDANAKVYDDNWQVFCGCNNIVGQGFNPYVAGRKGSYRLVKEYVFLSNRTQSKYNRNLNVRKDGTYTTFTPFWNYSNVWVSDTASWTWSNESTLYSMTGAQLETRDALNRYSAAQFAFNDRANIAIGQNAMYREIGFDSFEDYIFLDTENACKDSHFSFYKSFSYGTNGDLVGTLSGLSLSSDSHTGKYSLKIQNQNNYIKIRKNITPCK